MCLLLLVPCLKRVVRLDDQSPWRIGRHQRDDLGAFFFCKTRLSSSAGAITERFDPFGIEALDTLSHGLRVATKF